MGVDEQLLRRIRTFAHTPALERAMRRYSTLGEHGLGWFLLGVGGSVLDREPARRDRWRRGALTVAGAYGLNQLVKRVVRRPRPQLDGLPQLTRPHSQLSFPSAHSTTSFAAARGYRGLLPAGPMYAVAASLAYSRLYLGVHYPSDVLGGATLGTLLGESMVRRFGPVEAAVRGAAVARATKMAEVGG